MEQCLRGFARRFATSETGWLARLFVPWGQRLSSPRIYGPRFVRNHKLRRWGRHTAYLVLMGSDKRQSRKVTFVTMKKR